MTMLLKYMLIYREFLSNGLAQATSFRAHFTLVLVMDLLFYASALLTVDIVFSHVGMIGTWSRSDFLFFVSFMLALDGLHMTFISEAFWTLAEDIRKGTFDFTLLKPVSPFFIMFARHLRLPSLIILPIPLVLLFHFGSGMGLSLPMMLIIPLLLLIAFALLVSIEVLIAMGTFWLVDTYGINFLRIQLQQVGRWPEFVYRGTLKRILLFVLPILLVGSAPVHFLRSLATGTGLQEALGMMALMFFGIPLMAVATALVWKVVLLRYESASS